MSIIPKKTKFHYSFRNKVRKKERNPVEIEAIQVFGARNIWCNNKFHVNAFCQNYYPCTEIQETKQSNKTTFLNQVYTNRLLFGQYGIIFGTYSTLTAKFINTVTLDITKILKKRARIWLRLCCDTPKSAKPLGTRLGRGKTSVSHWETKISPGQVFFEFSGVSKSDMMTILKSIKNKSPTTLKLVCFQ